MKNYPNNLEATLSGLEEDLSRKCPGVRVVLPDGASVGMILPEEDNAYVHVYLLNVPGDEMLVIEDAAYDFWEAFRSESISFFLYTPQETAARFPAYAATVQARPSCKTVRNLMDAYRWQTAVPHPEPQPESWELVRRSQQMATLPSSSRDGMKSHAVYRSAVAADVEIDTTLPKAA